MLALHKRNNYASCVSTRTFQCFIACMLTSVLKNHFLKKENNYMNYPIRIEFNEVSQEFANYLIDNRNMLFNQFFSNLGPQEINRIDWGHNVREKTVIFVLHDIRWPFMSAQSVLDTGEKDDVLAFQ